MITPVEYYSTKIKRRLRDATKDYDTRKEMFKWLSWERSGGFGYVATISDTSEWVVKISWSGEYDGYNVYIDWCLERQGQPFIPEIYNVFEHETSGLRYVFMKKYIDKSSEIEDLFQTYISPIAGSKLNGSSFDPCEDKMHKLNVVRDGFGDFIKTIYKELGGKYFMDVHYKNVMVDEKGKWVVTDPISGKRPEPIKKPIENMTDYTNKMRSRGRVKSHVGIVNPWSKNMRLPSFKPFSFKRDAWKFPSVAHARGSLLRAHADLLGINLNGVVDDNMFRNQCMERFDIPKPRPFVQTNFYFDRADELQRFGEAVKKVPVIGKKGDRVFQQQKPFWQKDNKFA